MKNKDDELPAADVVRRREQALKRMLSTAHQPHGPVKERKIKTSRNPKKKPV